MKSVAEFRGSVTLSGRFSIGDHLKVGDEDGSSPSSVVVVVGGAATGRRGTTRSGNGIHWKTFKDLLRRAGASCASWATLAEALAKEEKEEEEEEARDHGSTLCVCCSVCMVRRRGAAFIPCGHTFCRLCSRKLWASRSNCPLCNGFILEVLNIF